MRSNARVLGHPIHPIVVNFPIASYVFTFAALVALASSGDPFWMRVALITNVVGVGTAILAAIPGSVDYFTVIPKQTATRRTGALHGVLNGLALVLFAVTLIVLWNRYNVGEAAPVALLLVLSGAGVAATAGAGYLGFELVQTHGVGIDERRRQEAALATAEPGGGRARWMEGEETYPQPAANAPTTVGTTVGTTTVRSASVEEGSPSRGQPAQGQPIDEGAEIRSAEPSPGRSGAEVGDISDSGTIHRH